jgi:hypothetical protein
MLREADAPPVKQGRKKIKVENAVGLSLAHDITEIRPGEYKGPSFRKGHRVEEKDLCHLMRLGKRHLYVLDLPEDQVHEDEAVLELALALAGPGVLCSQAPSEGKIQLTAAYPGLFKVDAAPLIRFNEIPEVMCASIHGNTSVTKGQVLAGTRAVPLVIHREVLDRAVGMAKDNYPIFSVTAFNPCKAGLIITGNEVYDGLIEDRFEDIVTEKLKAFGTTLADTVILPDDETVIADHVTRFIKKGLDLIITTGGMSVDPDDVTRLGIARAGVDQVHYSAGVLPGAMFLLAYQNQIPIIGIPACALYHRVTVFDLVLPLLLAGEKPVQRDLARFAHGGLCMDCPDCRFPACSFGKTG